MTDIDFCRTIEAYLAYVGRFCGHAFGRQFRQQFADHRGTAELAMLASPSREEYESFVRVVASMTPEEKSSPETLNDLDIQEIARRANVEPALAGLFVNGFVLARKKAGWSGSSSE